MRIDKNGDTAVVEMFDWFGFSSKHYRYSIDSFKGITYFLHPKMKMPIVAISTGPTYKSSNFVRFADLVFLQRWFNQRKAFV